jgi:GTP-binding protein Era
MTTKAGYCALIGKPNSGKSTLMNALTGAKLSIVTNKAQTTRKRVLGIYSSEETQIVFLDTPGILNPKYEMQERMMNYVDESIADADVIAVIIDIERFRDAESYFTGNTFEQIKNFTKPVLFLINKTDLIHDKKELLPVFEDLIKFNPNAQVLPISALKNDNVNAFITAIEKLLPESEFYYDPELLSTQPERFFVSELVREAVFTSYKEEIPYSTEVLISEFKERPNGKWYISADIVVERDSQKMIIIGKNGQKIKRVGLIARKQIEEHLDHEVYLELFVKVRKNWRDNPTLLRSYGY